MNNKIKIIIILFSSLFIFKANAIWYCYSPIGLNTQAIQTNPQSQCIFPTFWDESVQLCCSQTAVLEESSIFVQTYQQLPVPLDQAIPSRCRRAPHIFSSNRYECPSTMVLCEATTPEANYHLCCHRVAGQPECPNLSGQHSSQSYTGIGIDSLGVPCAAPDDNGNCPPGKVYLPGPKCCILRGLGYSMHSFPSSDKINEVNIPCIDRAVPGRESDCPANEKLCNDKNYFDLMTIECPFTCKRCGQIPANAVIFNANIPQLLGCFDRVGLNGRSDCPERKAYCLLPVWTAFLRFECPFTCGFCGENLIFNNETIKNNNHFPIQFPILPSLINVRN
uniref:ShKT domain-containing protein n=1 Tax=Meloidogyne enterolobii TaxID=390850 RepID=A0A6V7UM16_MELEN|nr:unnamed protein product [Meloidogyne enterolobii]